GLDWRASRGCLFFELQVRAASGEFAEACQPVEWNASHPDPSRRWYAQSTQVGLIRLRGICVCSAPLADRLRTRAQTHLSSCCALAGKARAPIGCCNGSGLSHERQKADLPYPDQIKRHAAE